MSVLSTYKGRIRNLSRMTRTRYLQQVEDFQRVVGVKDSYTTADVEKYLEVLEGEGKSSNYRRWCFFVLRSFYDVMRPDVDVDGHLPPGQEWPWFSRKQEKRVRPKQEEPKQPYLRLPEMQKVVETTEYPNEASDSTSRMVQVLLRIAVLTPIRRIELQRLDREDYHRPLLRIKTRKGGEARTLTLDEKTCNLLDSCLADRTDEDPALFISPLGKRISLSYLTLIFRQLLEGLGLYKPGMGWHSVRRGVATMLKKAGMDEAEIQEYGGWRSRSMVAKYVQLEPAEVEDKAKRVHPLIKRS